MTQYSAQLISIELGTAILLISSICAGVFALGGVLVSTYISLRLRQRTLEVHVDTLKRNVNDLGKMFRKFFQQE